MKQGHKRYHLAHILGTGAGVDGLQDEHLLLRLEVAPLLADPDIQIPVLLPLFLHIAFLNQVFPGRA